MSTIARLSIPGRILPPALVGDRGHKIRELSDTASVKQSKTKIFNRDFAWQDDAVVCLTGNRFSKLISPTGSGKTEIIKASAFHYAQVGKKSLIVVPQQHIGEGFKIADIQRKDGSICKFRIVPEFDFRGVEDSYHRNSVVDGLKRWLLQPITNTMDGRIAISTYSSLVLAYRNMTNEEKRNALTNLWLAVDEAHHISCVVGEDEELDEKELARLEKEGTQLGDVCEDLLKLDDSGLSVISATHFRGDGRPMFLEKASRKFETYEREFEDHWEWLNISEFRYDCTGYDEDPFDILIDIILSEAKQKHIVCVPARNKRFRKRNDSWVSNLISELGKHGIRCLDLVTEETKIENKAMLRADKEKYEQDGETDFDVIIACNLMREGTDWPPASRVHDHAPSPSTTRTIQTIGRMLRRDEQKHDIAYVTYFQNLQEHADDEQVREHVADRVNVALSGLLAAEDLFRPVKLDFGDGTDRTLTQAEDELFGSDKKAIKESFLAALDSAMKSGIIDSDDEFIDEKVFNQCAQHALGGGLSGGLLQMPKAIKWLREFAVRTMKANREMKKKPISPPIQPEWTHGGLDPSEIRLAGFSVTEKLDSGLLLFESRTNQGSLNQLDKIVRPLQQRGDEIIRRMMRTRTTNVKDPSAKRKAKKLKGKQNRNSDERFVSPSGTERF